ncbi:MAG: DUF559 domain-containing protein [Gemmatimonadetes bacterium]|nr:DUF559 domain-containing protein [Gemmatimonadota bacterium]
MASRPQILACGLTSSALGRRTRRGRYETVFRGVYRVGPSATHLTRPSAAALAVGPNAVISHSTAARVYGWLAPADAWRFDRADSVTPRRRIEGGVSVDATLLRGNRRSRPGLRVHCAGSLTSDEATTVAGIPVTTPIRTVLDAAAQLDAFTVERVVAAALRTGAVDRAALSVACSRYRGRRGIGRLRQVLDRPEMPRFTRSEAERRVLKAIRDSGLPTPRANVTAGPYEVDFLWDNLNVVLEVDGFEFHSSRRSFESDRERDGWLQAEGLLVVRLTWRQITREPMKTMVQLGRTLARRSAERGTRLA